MSKGKNKLSLKGLGVYWPGRLAGEGAGGWPGEMPGEVGT